MRIISIITRPKFILALSAALALGSQGQILLAQQMGSDWVDGDVDEIRARPNGPQPKLRAPRQYVPPPQTDQDNEDNDDRGQRQIPRYPDNLPVPPPPRTRRSEDGQSRQMRQDAGQRGDDGMPEGAAPVKGEELELTPPAPSLRVKGKSNVITGGITSSTFRDSHRTSRGLDKLSSQFMLNAPFLDTPKTVAVQPSAFKLWLDNNHPGAATRFSKDTIVEIKGKWDDCGHILHNFALPCTKVSPGQLGSTDLSHTKILLVNCGANFDQAGLQKVRDFVDRGGYLLSTDWALDSCISKAFPGFVEWNNDYTENSVVDAVVVDDDPILLAGVPRVAHWKLENRSQTVNVNRNRDVQVLARSRYLQDREASNLGILALTFPFGAGRVLHLVGHFDNNADRAFNNALPDPAPIIGISLRQAIAGNFITAALDGDMAAQDGN